jgi:hypothetical protein
MTVIIPLKPLPSQTLSVNLGGQSCRISLYQKTTGLYCDVFVNDTPIVIGSLCQNLNPIVRAAYTGFVGELALYDTWGEDDPVYTELGDQFQLAYGGPA